MQFVKSNLRSRLGRVRTYAIEGSGPRLAVRRPNRGWMSLWSSGTCQAAVRHGCQSARNALENRQPICTRMLHYPVGSIGIGRRRSALDILNDFNELGGGKRPLRSRLPTGRIHCQHAAIKMTTESHMCTRRPSQSRAIAQMLSQCCEPIIASSAASIKICMVF